MPIPWATILYFVLVCSAQSLDNQDAHTLHTCIHDEYVLGHQEDLIYTKSEQIYASDTISLLRNKVDDPTPSITTNNRQIRTLLNTSPLDSDEKYSCFQKGNAIDINGSPYTCTEDDVITPEKKSFLREVLLPAAKQRLESIFQVPPLAAPLYLSGPRCGFQGGIPVPINYTRQGGGLLDADIVVFVTGRPIKTAHVLAFGGQCQEDQIGRPIAGHLNFSPSRINVNPFSRDSQLGIILHELTHVMGFSYGKFARFHPPTGGIVQGYATVENHARAHNQNSQMEVVNTPRVATWVRKHFGCELLVGAPLEDGGAGGTSLSHWEKRTFMNEYMTGEATNNPVLSSLTMALFEDSGWYTINYTTAEDLVWGQNEGCGFVQDSCGKWPQERGYFCSDSSRSSCSFDLQSKGHCSVQKHSSALPIGNQYFDNPFLGGPSELADYCPYTSADASGWCFDTANGDLPTIVDNAEKFCKDCRCFESSLVKGLPIGGDERLACYQMTCVNATKLKDAQIYAVCADVPQDLAWPTIRYITPTSGTPGTKVTIFGSGFSNGTIVEIHSQCKDVLFISANMLIATVPTPDDFGNPAHIVAEQVNVIVRDGEGRTAEELVAFTLNSTGAGLSFFVVIIAWAIHHWLPCAAVIAAVSAGGMFWYKRRRDAILAKKYQRVHTEEDENDLLAYGDL